MPATGALSASAAFVVDQVQISRAGGDLLEPLVFAAVVQANIASLRHHPERARIDASGEALPDERRRPISVNAVAQSLGLPYETVRRRILSLARAGTCVLSPEGVYVPRSAIVSEQHAGIQLARLERLQVFHDALAASGFLGPHEILRATLPAARMRAVNTALSEYLLRTTERVVALTGEVLRGLVLLALLGANAQADARRELSRCSSLQLAAQLRMSREKVRRRVLELAELGHVRHLRGGWVALAPTSGPLADLAAANEAEVRRLFGRLREILEAAN